ncbi:MAG: replication-associated recombination protein A [Firmicutes bacterium]|nr:replication-associated recombination protein A [Bacillota bacterium]
MDLFDFSQEQRGTKKPLAERMRPTNLGEFVGQKHLVGEGSLLARAIRADQLGSCIFYGPAGCGKTSLASVVANCSNAEFEKLNAVSSGVTDAKMVIEKARENRKLYGKRTYLMLDECHRWNKAQSDSVLAAIEDGTIVFIGCTTENPYAQMTRAIVSRCRVFELLPLDKQDIVWGLERALQSPKGLLDLGVVCTDGVLAHFAFCANGDLRKAYNALELAALTTASNTQGQIVIDMQTAVQSVGKDAISIDETMYYDMLSAFCKSIRGSDPDAALFWAFRLLQSGCDPLILFRRLIVHCSEDVGLADSQALVIATNALLSFERIGMPEGRIILAHAIIYVAQTQKSNSVIEAIDKVSEDANSSQVQVPFYLRDKHYPSVLDDGTKYRYPPMCEDGAKTQQYLPDAFVHKKYFEMKYTKR